jgi:hypothetical protein
LKESPAKYATELAQVALSATFYLLDGIESDDPTKSETRGTAREVWKRALTCADTVISEYLNTPKPSSAEELERDQEILKGA